MTANTKLTCRGCGCEDLAIDADFGTAAASVALPDVHDHPTERLPFRLSACPVCQLIQLVDLPPLEALRPADQWIRYRDPERHLPDLALAVSQFLPRVNGLILGATYKDEPLLAEFERLGHTSTRVLDREADWQLTDARHGIETIQQRMTPDLARHWKAAHSAPLLFVVRHVLEHAHEMGPFLAACREIVADDGFVLLEVPGCEQELSRGDAGALWEEHVSYFTSTSLRNTLQRHGLRCDLIGNYPYAVEDCLFALARPALGAAVETADAAPGSGAGRDLIHTFREAVSRRRAAYRELNSRNNNAAGGWRCWGPGTARRPRRRSCSSPGSSIA